MVLIDSRGRKAETESERDTKFVQDVEAAGFPWYWYSGRGMYGRKCPAVSTDGFDRTEEDIIRATTVRGLKRDSMGYDLVVYTG